ncbi:MAG: discoidin domain-containing protein, partial [Pirellulaceae bacterium]
MKPCIERFGCLCLLLATGLSPTWAKGPELRSVKDEFQEAVARISAGAAVKPPEALDFPPQEARYVRVAIHETSGTTQPGIDELEIFGPESRDNLALAERGALASASSVLAGYAIHAVAHLNDGLYGNDHSWIAASRDSEWVQIELPEPASVARVIVTRDRTGKYRDRIPEVFEVLVSQDGRQWQPVAQRDRTVANRARRLPYLPVDRLPEKSWRGFLQYTFLRERATWSHIPADDHLSPLLVDRPAAPGGAPYWGRIARLAPLDRVLVLFEEMIERLDGEGLDVTAERVEVADLRRRAVEDPDSEPLYLAARHAKRQLLFRDPALAPLERILFSKRHPFLESHNYSEH